MKNQMLFITLFLASCILPLDSYGQITRGAQPAELYLSTDWYQDNNGDIHYGIFRSADNGATITLQYESSTNSPPNEMGIGRVLGDATPGALYNYYGELWISFDYGENWEYKETYGSGRFTSGCINGEIYKCCVNVEGSIWRSENYGSEFIEVTQDAKYILEVGNSIGNVYGFDGSPGIGFYIHYSSDYGENFIEIPVDSAIAFWEPSGMYPQISRGTENGELYLISWWLDSNYKIFHSMDTGYTWTEKFESETIDLYFWRVHYTAGREPGSFYVMRSRINPAGDHVWLYIDYSSDYGETFTTYFHDLDSTITGITTPETHNFKLSNYPNPFRTNTTFRFQLPDNCINPVLNIFDVHGTRINNFNISGKSSQVWDGIDENGHKVQHGIYLYNISYDNCFSHLKKLILTN